MNLYKKCENIISYSYNLLGDILKKIFEGIGLLSLICFSFFYTNKISTVIKNEDDILKEIESIKDQYKTEPISATVENDTIIPGISGVEIDVKKSYKKMKKVNSFNTNLLVYKDIKPEVSVNSVYDKYIISGNKNKKQVSLLFLLEGNDNTDKIVNILDNNNINATFYTDGVWFENNNEIVIDLIEKGHIIGNLGYNYSYLSSDITWMNAIVTKMAKQESTYCYNINKNKESLDRCSSNSSYTITPSVLISNNPLINVKKNLNNGSIIAMEVNDNLLKELQLVIDYINSKDLEIVTIEQLLDE